MTTQQPAVLFVRVPAVRAEIDAEWNAWYDNTHIEYRMNMPHFLGACRYRVLAGKPSCFVFYELSSVAALTSPRYLEHRQWEASRPAEAFESIAPKLPGFERGVYEQTYGPPWPSKSLDADAIFIAGHDPSSGGESSGNAWDGIEHTRAIEAMPGVVAVRRFKLAQALLTEKSGTKTARPQYFAAYYLTSEAVAEGEAFKQEIESTWREGDAAARFAILGRRIYSTPARKLGAG